MNLLDSSDSESVDGGVPLNGERVQDFHINADFARKFEYNKKREELARLESKLGGLPRKRKRRDDDAEETSSHSEAESASTSSESEDEDDVGELATEALDAEIQHALDAIRTKDPSVYDKNVRFYSERLDTSSQAGVPKTKPQSLYLRDYHRETLLSKANGNGDGNEHSAEPLPYTEEQEALRKSIVGEIEAAAANDDALEDSGQEESDLVFLSRKEKPHRPKKVLATELDVENADKDPETFLSNFMSSRAWVPTAESKFQPFESDDDEQDRRADEFEEAYNFRFEDPEKANEKLVSYARDTNERYSVRRPEEKGRKKRRERERQERETQKQELAEEKARLRKLKVEELEQKVRKIRRAAGLKGSNIDEKDWDRLLNGDWDDNRWEKEIQKRFGDTYYADEDFDSEQEGVEDAPQDRKLKKPKWNDDIEINDLVPDFDTGENAEFSLSDSEAQNNSEGKPIIQESKKKAHRDRDRKETKRQSRKDRQKVERLVDEKLDLEPTLHSGPSKKASFFRYRETSPTSFGLSAREILMAEDAQLNEYAGLKKLAAFRDPDKKRKDQRHLGKRARLRKWRKDTFGDEDGPSLEQNNAEPLSNAQEVQGTDEVMNGKKGKRRRRSSRKANISLDAASYHAPTDERE